MHGFWFWQCATIGADGISLWMFRVASKMPDSEARTSGGCGNTDAKPLAVPADKAIEEVHIEEIIPLSDGDILNVEEKADVESEATFDDLQGGFADGQIAFGAIVLPCFLNAGGPCF